MSSVMNLTFASSLTKLCEVNSSFDSGILKVAYPGENRNKTSISKDSFERCIKTIFNCPIVCNYDRDTDSLGGHDIDVVKTSDGNITIVNLTTPVGVVPESAHWEWQNFEEDDGTIREYLCINVLLWKRQEAYQKIKRDGIVAHSMEIKVISGERIDGIYHIYDFEFTAFALIGVEPCFEGSALELFSKQDFKQQLSEMMQELKENYTNVTTSMNTEDDNISTEFLNERRKDELDEKINLAANYDIDINNLDFSIDELSIEELTEKFEAIKKEREFALASNLFEELIRELDTHKIQRDWGECSRYWFVDYDLEAGEVYCYDVEDWLLYGFKFEKNGDGVIIDIESKKRKKYSITDFDEGEQKSPFSEVFSMLEEEIAKNAEWKSKYQKAAEDIEVANAELSELRKYRDDNENAILEAKKNEIFEQFSDLNGISEFETLRENCKDYNTDTIEEKCYAIRGRNSSVEKFSLENKAVRIKVAETNIETEPYGGIFVKYGTNKKH